MLIDSVPVRRTICITYITLFNIPIHILKGNLIVTLGESVAVYKTRSTTYITIIGITILLRDNVVVHRKMPTTNVTHFKSSSMTNG